MIEHCRNLDSLSSMVILFLIGNSKLCDADINFKGDICCTWRYRHSNFANKHGLGC